MFFVSAQYLTTQVFLLFTLNCVDSLLINVGGMSCITPQCGNWLMMVVRRSVLRSRASLFYFLVPEIAVP